MTFSARDHARELLEGSGTDWSFKAVMESLPYDFEGDVGPAVHAVLAELESAQVTVTFPTTATCCPHCPHREDPR